MNYLIRKYFYNSKKIINKLNLIELEIGTIENKNEIIKNLSNKYYYGISYNFNNPEKKKFISGIVDELFYTCFSESSYYPFFIFNLIRFKNLNEDYNRDLNIDLKIKIHSWLYDRYKDVYKGVGSIKNYHTKYYEIKKGNK